MSYFILIPLSIMFLERDMMGMVCDRFDLFGGLSAQHEPVNSSTPTRSFTLALMSSVATYSFSSHSYHFAKFAANLLHLSQCEVNGGIC